MSFRTVWATGNDTVHGRLLRQRAAVRALVVILEQLRQLGVDAPGLHLVDADHERHHAEPQTARRRTAGRDQPALGHLLELAAQRLRIAARAAADADSDLGRRFQRQAQPRGQRRLLRA